MVKCNFGAVFLGIETPDTDSLKLTKKTQNNRDPLDESIEKISRSGLRIMAGFIIGFDNEKPGAGQRIVDFVEKTSIPTATFSMLQALPDTGLSKRLAAAGRLLDDGLGGGDINQTTLMNFIPTRPMEQIAREFVDGFWVLYDPVKYLDRTYRHFMMFKDVKFPRKPAWARGEPDPFAKRSMRVVMWRQGVVRKSRWKFWLRLYQMYRHNPGGIGSYLSTCAQAEHFLSYRELVRKEIKEQLSKRLTIHSEVSDGTPKRVDGKLSLNVIPEEPVACGRD